MRLVRVSASIGIRGFDETRVSLDGEDQGIAVTREYRVVGHSVEHVDGE